LSRADKTQTSITYDLILDESRERLQTLEVRVRCAMSGAGGDRHVAYKLVYEVSRQGDVDRFPVPDAAAQLLR
jgi:hypothetical protein